MAVFEPAGNVVVTFVNVLRVSSGKAKVTSFTSIEGTPE